MMDITQITATLNHRQLQLEQQISHLQQQLLGAKGEAAEKLTRDLTELQHLQQKLAKSRDMALLAHALQTSHSPNASSNKQLIGLALSVFSGLGLLALVIIALCT